MYALACELGVCIFVAKGRVSNNVIRVNLAAVFKNHRHQSIIISIAITDTMAADDY